MRFSCGWKATLQTWTARLPNGVAIDASHPILQRNSCNRSWLGLLVANHQRPASPAGAAPPRRAMKMGVDATAMSGESNVVVAKCEKLTIPALQSGSKIHNHGQRSIQRRTTYLVAFCQARAA